MQSDPIKGRAPNVGAKLILNDTIAVDDAFAYTFH